MPAPPGLPPLPPPRLELPAPRRNRAGAWISLVAHVALLLLIVELTRETTFWSPAPSRATSSENSGGGGGGRQVNLIQLPAPEPAPAPPPPEVEPPVKVPTTITPPPPPAPVQPPPADTTPPSAAASDTPGSGGGSGGQSGTGAGPGSGAGIGPGSGGSGTAAPDTAAGRARPPEPTRLILPPFDYPRSMRGVTIDVNFFVLADGRVDHVVFVPEIPDRAYAKKLEDAMRAYRFRPARSPDGLPVAGVAIVKVSF